MNLNKFKKITRLFMPRFATYIVFSTTAGRIAETARQYSLSSEYEAVYVTPELRPNIERSRPDYWKMANQYLSAGHKGFAFAKEVILRAWLGFITTTPGL